MGACNSAISNKALKNLQNTTYKPDALFNSMLEQLVLTGYIRQHTINFLPKSAVKCIFEYINSGVIWNIKNHHLTQFYNNNDNNNNIDIMYGPEFKLLNGRGLLFQLTLTYSSNKYLICFFELKQMKEYIKNVTIKFKLILPQINYEYIRTRSINFNSKCKAFGWGYNILFYEIKQFQSFNIECYANIIHVEYDNGNYDTNLKHYISPIIPINQFDNIYFNWNINKTLLNKWKNIKFHPYFYSSTFGNDCWSLVCAPNGNCKKDNDGYISMHFELLQLPFKIEMINIKYCINIYCDIGIKKIKKYFKDGQDWISLNADDKSIRSSGIKLDDKQLLNKLESLSFEVSIQITDIYHRY